MLQKPGNLKSYASSEKLFDILIQVTGKTLYPLAEMYALKAFDTEKILALKLKSLVYLDKSGKKIIKNPDIRALEKYWPDTFQRVFENNFAIQEHQDTESNQITKIIVPKDDSGKYVLIYFLFL